MTLPITLDELGRRIDSVQNLITDIQGKQLSFYDKITDLLTKVMKVDVLEVQVKNVADMATECRNKNYAEHIKIFDKLSGVTSDVAVTPTRDEIEQKDDKVVNKTEKVILQVWEVLKLVLAVVIAAKIAGKI